MLVLQSIVIQVSERHALVNFCKLLQHDDIGHEIIFRAQYNGTIITCRKEVDDASVRDIWLRYLHRK